jgi:hypothetical protein
MPIPTLPKLLIDASVYIVMLEWQDSIISHTEFIKRLEHVDLAPVFVNSVLTGVFTTSQGG